MVWPLPIQYPIPDYVQKEAQKEISALSNLFRFDKQAKNICVRIDNSILVGGLLWA